MGDMALFVGDDGPSLVPLLALLADADRWRVSARTSSRETLDCEKGASEVSRCSMNLEEVILAALIS